MSSGAFHGRTTRASSASVPAASVLSSGGQSLAFELKGQGRLFYEARLRYVTKELPASPLDRGFFVKKIVTVVKPEELAKLTSARAHAFGVDVRRGRLGLDRFVVISPSPRDFVVIDDPLPAGLEPVDTTLRTTAGDLEPAPSRLSDEPEDGARDDRIAEGTEYLSSWVHREMHDDRVLFFVEHLAAGMYHYRYLARATTLG